MPVYLFIINALSFTFMCLDKHFARTHRRRVPESTLLTFAACGGSLGALLGMTLAHHKTRKPKFYITVPLLLALHGVLLLLLFT